MPRDRRILILVTAALITAIVWACALIPRSSTLTITFLDVGDGLSCVVRTPSGKTMVVDCGTSSWRDDRSVGDRLVARYLQRQGVSSIDVAVLTHPHADHVSGYANLLREKPAKLILDSGIPHPSPLYEQFLNAARKSRVPYRIARRGQSLEFGDGVTAQILSPTPDETPADLNNASIVIRLTYRDTAIMLMGDAGEDAEKRILAAGPQVRAQVLQVGHHGSADASSIEWLGAVKPKIAVISCARKSRYGHPSPDVVRRLELMGTKVFITGRDGAVEISTDGTTTNARSHYSPR